MKVGLFIIFFIIGFFVKAQLPAFQWAKQMGDAGFDAGRSIAIDGMSGNVYTTGGFQGTVDFDPGTSVFNLTSVGNADIFISKLDPIGNFIWAISIGGTLSDGGQNITTDASGNIYITGSFEGTVDFDPGMSVVNLTSAGGSDAFVLKMDALGNLIWAKQMGGSGIDYGSSIKVDPSGNVYTIGNFSGTADFDPGVGTANLTALGGDDLFILKLDAAGNYVWAQQIGGIGSDAGRSIALDATGNIYATGMFQQTVDFDPGVGIFNLTSYGSPITSSNDVFVLKLDVSGNYIWAKQMGGMAYESGSCITLDGLGNAYTIGDLQGTGDYDPDIGVANLTSIGSNDVFISKLDVNGNFVWAKSVGGTLNDFGLSVTLDAVGDMYISGYFFGTVDFDPGVSVSNLVSFGGFDIFISKLDPSGNLLWARQLGGPSNDFGNGTDVDVFGNIYTTGAFNGTCDFDEGAGIFNLTSAGTFDIFVHKMSQCTAPTSPMNVTPIGNQNICSNTTATLSATSTGTISWYATPTSTLALGTGTVYTTSALSIGSYTYYTEAQSCLISSSRTPITVTVTSSPTVTVNSSSICLGQQTATLIANGAMSYSWTPTISLSTSTGSNVIATPTINQVYTVVGTDANACTNTTTTSVTVYTLPIITVNTSTICLGQQTATLTTSGAAIYSWIPSTDLSSTTGSTVTGNPISTQNYTVLGTDANGCINSNTTVITVNSLPTLSVSGGSVCMGQQSATLTATGASTYSWMPSIGLSSTTGAVITGTPSSSQNYTVVGTDLNGCTSSTTISITVVGIPTITVNSATICLHQQANLTVSGSSSGTFSWNPSINLSSPTGTNVFSTTNLTETYTITNLTSNGCITTTTASVLVNSLPTITATGNASIQVGQTTLLQASGGINYVWTPNDGSLSCLACSNPIAQPTTTTEYIVIGYDTNKCMNYDTVLVLVDFVCGDFFIPNVFSPNGDGLNDQVNVHGFCIGTYELKIFDRWGEKVFETTSKTESWDGSYKGKALNAGVFMYKMDGFTIDHKPFSMKGNVTLLR